MSLDTIDPDSPYPLKEACEVFLRGKVTPATLRAEAERGNLVIERIGRKDFVTLRAIQDMRKGCRVERKVPAHTSTQQSKSGLSGMESTSVALDAARASAKALKSFPRSTFPKNTSQ
jgi:hypothetical protein